MVGGVSFLHSPPRWVAGPLQVMSSGTLATFSPAHSDDRGSRPAVGGEQDKIPPRNKEALMLSRKGPTGLQTE